MQHQDWTNVTLKNPSKIKVEKTIVKRPQEKDSFIKKLYENNDTFKLEKISHALSKEIISIRLSLKKNQVDMAKLIGIPFNVYNDIENGKSIYSSETKKTIQTIQKISGIKIINK